MIFLFQTSEFLKPPEVGEESARRPLWMALYDIRFQVRAFNQTQDDGQNHDFSKFFQKSTGQKSF